MKKGLDIESLSKTELDGQQLLDKELERLKKVLSHGHDLRVKWIPGGNGKLSGEVKGDWIFIYDEDIDTAVETLKHEILDYAISKVIEPYMLMTNKLIGLLNEMVYKRKENLVDSFAKLL